MPELETYGLLPLHNFFNRGLSKSRRKVESHFKIRINRPLLLPLLGHTHAPFDVDKQL